MKVSALQIGFISILRKITAWAFGMELFGKLFLTTFRIVAVGLIIWYLAKIIKENYKTGYIVCLSLILALVP